MKAGKGLLYGVLLAGGCWMGPGRGLAQTVSDTIPLGGNAWAGPDAGVLRGGRIDTEGIVRWSDSSKWFDTWLRVTATGKLRVWVCAAVPEGKSRLKVALGSGGMAGTSKGVGLEVGGAEKRWYNAGEFTITDTGYQCIRIKGLSRSGPYFAEIPSIVVQGAPLQGRTAYVPNNEGNFFHWGRRGPSVHLNYTLPAGSAAEWFYNEVTVPEGQDVQGSYFMACGFAQGYFGMQVNSPTSRHILFSVWSPFETNDPQAIPDSQKILLLKKGEGVHAGAFGNEGSGGQSYLDYPWKAAHTYRFLLRAHPADHRYTDFTAWFFAPEEGRWRLIASFSRPQTQSWLSNLHSFLENFEPDQGTHQRYVLFNHQWVRDAGGQWISLNRARFSVDNTGRKGYRMDYAGGIRDSAFYLQNDGFFNQYTPAGIELERPGGGAPPAIDFTGLP
jgi:Domain of unknown function (DUF3472)/Domain of unknown function (DUF5077)